MICHIKGRLYGVRAFGWQVDYRPDGWLPFSVRHGLRKGRPDDWRVLSLGRFGCMTLARTYRLQMNPSGSGAMTTRKAVR